MAFQPGQSSSSATALWRLAFAMAAGLIVTIAFPVSLSSTSQFFGTAAMGLVIAGACAMIGGLTGFLFGIPRSLQADMATTSTSNSPGAATERATYGVNTNLEQISDWLTKILVGVGLTQLNGIPDKLGELAGFLAPAFGNEGVFAIGVVLYFLIAGFLFGYLWTRLFMKGALRHADEVLAELKSELQQQTEQDARALALVRQQLKPSAGSTSVSEQELRQAIPNASPQVRAMIRQEAVGAQRAERSIPIYRALADTDEDFDDHAQLAYRLKDQRTPDWAGAERELTTAIELRGAADPSFGWYEFYRALSRINLDPTKTGPSPSREPIISDLRTAVRDPNVAEDVKKTDVIVDWMRRNSVSTQDLGI